MKPVQDRNELAELFRADPLVHIYALADLDEPFWSESTWYRRDNAAVGIVGLGGTATAGYAMSRIAPHQTLSLLRDVIDEYPTGTWITGPMGLADQVEQVRPIDRKGPHTRMVIPNEVPVARDARATRLTADDAAAIKALHRQDPGAAFFLPSMMRTGTFVGIRDAEGDLIASAGTHTASRTFGVAAIGAVIVHPAHRGSGLGSAVTSDLVDRLRTDHDTIGLNVSSRNHGAIRLYERLGFDSIVEYEEIELL